VTEIGTTARRDGDFPIVFDMLFRTLTWCSLQSYVWCDHLR